MTGLFSDLVNMAPVDDCRRLALVHLHFLWQGALLAIVAWIGASVLRSRRAQTRYAFHLGILLAMIACPAATFVLLRPTAQPAIIAPTPNMPALPVFVEVPAEVFLSVPAARPPAVTVEATTWIALGWSAGVMVMSLRLLAGTIGIARLRRTRQKLSAALLDRSLGLARALSLRRVEFGVSARLTDAVAVGFLRPLVLLPAAWIAELPTDVLEAVIAHELAHIRRLDVWINAFQRVAETMLFYHPAVWWISSRLTEEREMCCDELALEAIKSPLNYARALEHVAANRLIGRAPALATGMGGRHMLLRRIRNILRYEPQARSAASWPASLLAVGVACLVTIASTGTVSYLHAEPKEEKQEPATKEKSKPNVETSTDDLKTPSPIPEISNDVRTADRAATEMKKAGMDADLVNFVARIASLLHQRDTDLRTVQQRAGQLRDENVRLKRDMELERQRAAELQTVKSPERKQRIERTIAAMTDAGVEPSLVQFVREAFSDLDSLSNLVSQRKEDRAAIARSKEHAEQRIEQLTLDLRSASKQFIELQEKNKRLVLELEHHRGELRRLLGNEPERTARAHKTIDAMVEANVDPKFVQFARQLFATLVQRDTDLSNVQQRAGALRDENEQLKRDIENHVQRARRREQELRQEVNKSLEQLKTALERLDEAGSSKAKPAEPANPTSLLPQGMHAVTVPIATAGGVKGFIQPGDVVNIQVRFRPRSANENARIETMRE